MKFAVSEVTLSPPVPAPVTYDAWMHITQHLGPCTESRQVQWLYSLVSVQGDRSVCVYQVPYADAAREAYREARMPFQRIWQADLWVNQDVANVPHGSSLIVTEVNYDPPLTRAIYESERRQAEWCYQALNVEHILSAVLPDGTYSICVFSAASAEQVRSLYRKFNKPFKQIWKATLIRPVLTEITS